MRGGEGGAGLVVACLLRTKERKQLWTDYPLMSRAKADHLRTFFFVFFVFCFLLFFFLPKCVSCDISFSLPGELK